NDFNTNLTPEEDRISQTSSYYNFTRVILKNKLDGFTNIADLIDKKPSFTYFQKIKNNSTMATKLDYIFIDNNNVQFCKQVNTKFENSDYLLVKITINFSKYINSSFAN
ncbi:10928_t:CDS:1, partial [Cetraspora pellucida]